MSKLEIIPGTEVLRRIANGSMKPGDQYRRMNHHYPISLFIVPGKEEYSEEIMPSKKSFKEDKFIVVKLEYAGHVKDNRSEKEVAAEVESERKEEALRIAALYQTREQFKKNLFEPRKQCPSDYGLFDWCGQSCKKCINQALSECTVTFVGDEK